jgi:hypothetical protein
MEITTHLSRVDEAFSSDSSRVRGRESVVKRARKASGGRETADWRFQAEWVMGWQINDHECGD